MTDEIHRPPRRNFADFRSDTVTRPTEEMLQAMVTAPLGDDVFGDDPTVHRLEETAARRMGKEAALFVPSGTMGNQIAIRNHTSPGEEMLVEAGAHSFLYEAGGAAALSSVQTWPIENARGIPSTEQIRSRLRPDDPHCPRSTLLCLENTHNRYGGRVIPLEALREVATFARSHGLRVHLDGARLFHAEVASGIPASHYAEVADSVMFCLSKGLSAPVGSILAGTAEFISKARRTRKLLGGGMRQAGLIAAAGQVALESMVERLAEDHRRARRLAENLAPLPGIRIDPQEVETNIVLIHLTAKELPPGLQTAEELRERLEEKKVAAFVFATDTLRLTTHKDVDDDDVDRAIREVTALLTPR